MENLDIQNAQSGHHILYSFRRCPYAMRARLALAAAKIPLEHRELVLRDKPAHMLEISPKGTVPVLLTKEGCVIDESLDIADWALKQSDLMCWLNLSDEGLEKSKELISENDSSFKKALDRYKYPNRYLDEEGAAETDWRGEALHFLDKLEFYLKEGEYLFGNKESFADMMIFPFVRQFANVDKVWWETQAPVPRVREWLNGLVNSEIFLEIMEKHKPWKPEDAPLYKNLK